MPAPHTPSWLEIDLPAVKHNVHALRTLIGPDCGVLAIVKCNAYGHGVQEISNAALDAGVSGLCIASLHEAQELRRMGIDAPTLLLNSTGPEHARDISIMHLTQALYSQEMAEALAEAALRVGYGVAAHIKVDSGMGRLGIPPETVGSFVANLAPINSAVGGFSSLSITGVFSHLATSDEDDESFALEQFERFRQCVEELRRINPGIKAHIANSAAALKFPQMRMDYVRAGLLIYGIYPYDGAESVIDLKPVLSWKTTIACARRVEPGIPVSYGRTWRASAPTTIATLPVGYGDGYPRTLSNSGYVLFRGQLRPVVGTVCMNHVLIDVGDEPDIKQGEEVVLIGSQGENSITASQVAKWANTVPHEILARTSRHIDRIYYN